MATREDPKFDWSKTWVADMFMSGEDAVEHEARIERLQGITPEIKRQREIKAGVITGSVGIGLMILLFVLMEGIIAGGRVSAAAAEILSRLWVVGVIPVMVGAALIFNGTFISKKRDALSTNLTDTATNELDPAPLENYLGPADTNQLETREPFSVTDETTRHLSQKSRGRE